MQPELVAALERARDTGRLPGDVVAGLLRVARGELISVQTELRVALYAGVLLVAAGVGLLLQQELHRLGPLGVACGLAAASALCFWWVARHARPFTWDRDVSPHLAFDYILLLGTLLATLDLAYVEAQLTPLGPEWPWHLLVVSLCTGAVAVRYDSRVVFSVALSSFAAWRGVAVSLEPDAIWSFHHAPASLRLNAIGSGLLFLVVARSLARWRRKPHFEPLTTTLGLALALGGLVSGIDTRGAPGLGWTFATLLAAAGVLAWAWSVKRFVPLAMGLAAAYVGVTALFFRLRPGDELAATWFLVTSVGLVVTLVAVHRLLREDE